MSSKISKGLCAMVLWTMTSTAHAILLEFQPAAQDVIVGSPVDVAVVISGLGVSMAPSLGVYDINVNFDPSVLSLTGVAFGGQLDFGLGSFADSTLGVGTVNVFELSFEPVFVLDALQPDAFTLFTLSFDTLAVGSSSLDVPSFLLGDAFGSPLDVQVATGSVNVRQIASVPEPYTIALLGIGLAGLGWMGRRKKNT